MLAAERPLNTQIQEGLVAAPPRQEMRSRLFRQTGLPRQKPEPDVLCAGAGSAGVFAPDIPDELLDFRALLLSHPVTQVAG